MLSTIISYSTLYNINLGGFVMNVLGVIDELEVMYKNKDKENDYVGFEVTNDKFLTNGKEIIIVLGEQVYKFVGEDSNVFGIAKRMIKEGETSLNIT